MAKPSHESAARPRLLVTELWGLGDLALAMPFLHHASARARVTLLAKPNAADLLQRFAPNVEHVTLTAPWTAFVGKYRLLRWPWRELTRVRRQLRAQRFDIGVSARPDPRDHLVLWLAGARRRIGFARTGSRALLTDALPPPAQPHRRDHWRAIMERIGWPADDYGPLETRSGAAGRRSVVLHTGAGQAVRRWPAERFAALAARLRESGWNVTLLDDTPLAFPELFRVLGEARAFIGNDSGPGHVAALLGVPTFTIFGPSLPEAFSTLHPQAEWIEGAACAYRPCWDSCRFAEPHCILALSVDDVWSRVQPWLSRR